MQAERFKALTLTSILIASATIPIQLGISFLTGDFLISSSGSISYLPTPPLHVEGRYIKNSYGQTVFIRGARAPIFEDTCNARAALPGEMWDSYASKTTWRPQAINAMLDAARNWGFSTIASFMWIDWWIYNSRSELGETRDTIVSDRPYQQNIDEFITLAEKKGIYVEIRAYSVEAGWGGVGEGRVEFPFPVPGESNTHDGHILPNAKWPNGTAIFPGMTGAQAFAQYWFSVAYKLAKHPNVIFHLYDEPAISEANRQVWFDAATLAIQKIREAETAKGGYKHLVQVHWGYDADCLWMEDWIKQGLPGSSSADNIIFSNHIYRDQGAGYEDTYGPPPYPYDYAIQKAILQYKPYDPQIPDPYKPYGRAYKYIIDTYNITIVVHGGAYRGWENAEEYIAFQNTLRILNEWETGYWIYVWYRTNFTWAIMNTEPMVASPNRIGQALIDAIAAGKT